MANDTSITELRSRARMRADMESSTFVTDTELDYYLNVGLSELHDILVQRYEDYFVKSQAWDTSTQANGIYSLVTIGASDFYKVLGVDLDVSGTTYRIRPFSFQERNMYNSAVDQLTSYETVRYHIQDSNIRLIPAPISGTATLWYVPQITKITASSATDTLSELMGGGLAVMIGWEEFIVLSAAIKMLQKEESDVTILLGEKQLIQRNIEQAASNRDAGEPHRITDVDRGTSNWNVHWV